MDCCDIYIFIEMGRKGKLLKFLSQQFIGKMLFFYAAGKIKCHLHTMPMILAVWIDFFLEKFYLEQVPENIHSWKSIKNYSYFTYRWNNS